jgi:hypothetical protein
MIAVFCMMFRAPMPNLSPDLTDKIEAALLSQVSKIADQVCDGMFIIGAAVLLKNRDGLGGPRNVVGFISHALPSTWPLTGEKLFPSRISASGNRSPSPLSTFAKLVRQMNVWCWSQSGRGVDIDAGAPPTGRRCLKADAVSSGWCRPTSGS